jgi:hypothetical protein
LDGQSGICKSAGDPKDTGKIRGKRNFSQTVIGAIKEERIAPTQAAVPASYTVATTI